MRTLIIPFLILFFTAAFLTPVRAQVNAALNKPVTTAYSTSTNGTTWPGYPPSNLTDGNTTTFSHPNQMAATLGFRFDINLGRSWTLNRLRIYNRADGCCPERLTNYRVSILEDNGAGAPAPTPVWTAVIRQNGTNSGAGGFDEVLASQHAAGTFAGQWIRLENISGSAYVVQTGEVQALSFDVTTSNIALYKPVTTSGPAYASLPASNLNDGSLTTLTHPAGGAGATNGYYYQIDFLNDYVLDRAVIYARADGCCPERLTKYKVSLFADNAGAPGAETWSGEMHMDGTYPTSGSADTVRAENGTGDFHGRFLRVTNLSNEAYNPQISEIEAYRPPAPQIKYFTTDAGNITKVNAPGMPAQATLSWNVQGATSLSIDHGVGTVASPSGSVVVSPTALTTYTLTATGVTGNSTATVTVAVDAPQLPPRINEIMAENDGSLADEDDSQPDWIELYNPNTFTLGLAGAHLSDNPNNALKWAFPAGAAIPPNGFLIVFASSKNRAVAGSPLHTNFSLQNAGETVSLYAPGGTLWSRIPADYPTTQTYPVQYRDTSYGVDGGGQVRYFRPSTPNAANAASGFTTVVEDTSFSVKRGLYTTPQSVAITCLTPGATIRYTVNGTKPTESNGTVYTAPISVTATTAIRAAAFLAGSAPSNVDTHTYIFPNSVASQPTMQAAITGNATWGPQIPQGLQDVPSVSLVTPSTAALNDNTETEASFEFIHPTDATKSAHAGTGVDFFGGAFTSFAKKSFRLHFRGVYGDKKLKAPLFEGHEHGQHAVQEFDGLELRNGSHDMVDRGFYMSNIFTDQAMMEMGNLSPHGRFVHVYLNGVYWGLYHMRERWNAAMHASYLGGQTEDYEAINGNYNVGGWAVPGQPFDGDGAAWEYAKAMRTNYAELRGLIDVGNYADYMITWMFGNAEDEWRGVSPNRLVGPGSGSRFVINDSDGWLSVGSSNTVGSWDGNDNNTARASTWNGTTFTAGRSAGDGPGSLLGAMVLTAGSDFKTLLADRIHRALFNGGALTPAVNQARLNTLCTAIERAFIAESARWNYRNPTSWTTAKNVCLNNWMPNRTNTVLTQYRNAGLYPTLNAPVFSQNGGTFAPGFALGMTAAGAPAGSTIRYTMDGTDPRLAGGAVSAGALTWTANVPLTVNTVVKARTLSPTNEWSALQVGFFQLNTSTPVPSGSVVPAELHFNPTGDDDAEFVELMNVSNGAVNLRGCRFTTGIDFAFSEYRDTLLAPGQRLVLVDSEFVHRARYGWNRTIDGIYFDNLNNDGEQIVFVSSAATIFDMTFSETWHRLADGGGPSLTLIHPQTGLNLSDPLNWRSSQGNDGTPGAGDTGPAFSGTAGADADGDGYSALVEYSLGTSDTSAASVPVVEFLSDAAPSFSYVRAAAADDAIIIPEVSSDFSNWMSGAAVSPVNEEALPDGHVKVTMAPAPDIVAGATHFYVRLRVVLR